MEKFTRNIIDSHIHIYDWFNKDGVEFTKLLDDIQDNLGLKGIGIASQADRLYGGADINIMCAVYKLHNKNAYAFGNIVFPDYPACPPLAEGLDSLTQYNEFMEMGFDGIKILYKPDVQKRLGLLINDPYYEPFFAQAEKDGTHILWHVADPEICWDKEYTGPWSYRDGTYPAYKDMYEESFEVMRRHPDLNVTFAHFLFLSEKPELLERIFERYENVKIDIVPHPGMYKVFTDNYEFYREFFVKYSDRIIFGTDIEVPINNKCENQIISVYDAIATDKEIENLCGMKATVKGLALPEEILEKVLYTNFLNTCSRHPKAINKTALRRYIDKYTQYILNEKNKKAVLDYAKTL